MCRQKSLHMGKRSGCNPRKCQYCDRTFQKLYEFYQHMRKHTGITPFRCGRCGLYYSQSSSLNRHKSLNRCRRTRLKDASGNKVSQKQTSSSPKEQIKLDEAPSSIPHAKLIDCYVKLVDCCQEKQPPQKNSCETCGKSFRLRAQLAAHRRTHTDERAFKCHNCHKGLQASLQSLQTQKKTLPKDRESCKICMSIEIFSGGVQVSHLSRCFQIFLQPFPAHKRGVSERIFKTRKG